MISARKLFARSNGGSIGRSMLVASMSVAAIATSATGAYFTDSDAPSDSVFATGDVDLALSATTALVAKPANMAPGDVEYGSVTVTNNGSLEMRYALASVTNEDFLAAQLDLTVWDESAEVSSDGVCSTTTVPDTTLYSASDLGSIAGTKVFGDATTGTQTGDRVLAAGADEVLCFEVSLPTTTGNDYETKSTTATFTFSSEQTANNA